MVLVIGAGSLIAQQPQGTPASHKRASITVPFVGCRTDGQVGPMEAPKGASPSLSIAPKESQQLAYYSSEIGFGVLAPRGWYCFGTYGSGGERLFVSPQPVDTGNLSSDDWSGFLGPAIQLNHSYGGTSGRFMVAEIIARVFPAYKAFATDVMRELSPSDSFSFGPYPKDTVTYRSKTVVEYSTPAQTDGLATRYGLKKNDNPIDGVTILVEREPDVLLLAVRLPPGSTGLTSAVIHQVEREAERRPQPGADARRRSR